MIIDAVHTSQSIAIVHISGRGEEKVCRGLILISRPQLITSCASNSDTRLVRRINYIATGKLIVAGHRKADGNFPLKRFQSLMSWWIGRALPIDLFTRIYPRKVGWLTFTYFPMRNFYVMFNFRAIKIIENTIDIPLWIQVTDRSNLNKNVLRSIIFSIRLEISSLQRCKLHSCKLTTVRLSVCFFLLFSQIDPI